MSRRHPNPRLVKIHRSYSIEEVVATLGVHKNTVRNWLRQGLAAIDSQRPTLIHGQTLATFLRDRRLANRQTCKPEEIFCLRCRRPVIPAGNTVDYIAITEISGNLRGICPDCDCLIHRRVTLARLDLVSGQLDVVVPQAEERIRECVSPSVNCDSR